MLRYSIASVVCVLAILISGGCTKPTHESIAKDKVAKIKEVVAILKTVKDESSAKSASEKLKGLKDEMKQLEDQEKALPAATAEETKAIEAANKKEMEDVGKDFFGEMIRIESDPKLAAIVEPLMKDSPMSK